MIEPRTSDYLGHMIRAASEAQSFIEGLDRDSFLNDRRTQQAVVMCLITIGEAAARIMDADPAFVRVHPSMPWKSMRGMRNRLAHGYFETDFAIVWETVQAELPQLIASLSALHPLSAATDPKP